MPELKGDIFDLDPPLFCWEHDSPYEFVRCDAGCEDGWRWEGAEEGIDIALRCSSCFGKGGTWVCSACGLVASRSEG